MAINLATRASQVQSFVTGMRCKQPGGGDWCQMNLDLEWLKEVDPCEQKFPEKKKKAIHTLNIPQG